MKKIRGGGVGDSNFDITDYSEKKKEIDNKEGVFIQIEYSEEEYFN